MSSASRPPLATCIVSILAAFTAQLVATEAAYDEDVTKWIEVSRPSKSAEHQIWYLAADYSQICWVVSNKSGNVRATKTSCDPLDRNSQRPSFETKAENFSAGLAYQRVDDGWLVGFNEGEFGAALYWFSNDGRKKYKISGDQVVEFMSTPRGIIAIQGLNHMGFNGGSLIRLAKDVKTDRWTSKELTALPAAPESFLRLKDGRLFVALSDSLVLLKDNRLETLVKETDWIRPDTIVVSEDGRKVYVGALQWVCEYDMQTKHFRYLVPDLSFVNKLSKEEEDKLRELYR